MRARSRASCTFRAVTRAYIKSFMMAPRRSRMRRTRTGKRIELSARDREIFRVMGGYRYLPSTYIHAFVGGASETRFKERLGDLFHEGYLDRPEQQWEIASCRHRPVIHELGPAAKRIVRDHATVLEPRTWLSGAPHRQFSHSLLICEVLASFELATRARAGLRFISWPEMLAKAPAATQASATPFRLPTGTSAGAVIPDGLFGVEYAMSGRKTYRFFALEADRATMPVARSSSDQTSYLAKLTAYREIIARHGYKTHWGLPNLLVLTVTPSRSRVAEIIRRVETEFESSSTFLFRAMDPSELRGPATQLLFDPWERAGLPPLRIDE